MDNTRGFSIIMYLLNLTVLICLIGCTNSTDIADEILNGDNGDAKDGIGRIVMNQTGGFAGVSRKITIQEENGSIVLTSVDERTHQQSEDSVSPEEFAELWQMLEANDIFTLSTNAKLLDTVADAFNYELIVERGEKRNQFSVYAPDLLVDGGETRYNAIVSAIEQFADSHLQGLENFIVADLPINNISVEILESFPLQIHVVVDGTLNDGCTTLNEITQRREGNTIHLRITTKRPKDAFCIQVITDIQERIPLEGGFLPGRYKIIVNDVEKEIKI